MQRFALPLLSLGKDIIISEDSFVHQISRVLRSNIGDAVILFNGDGKEYAYAISSITKKDVRLSFKREYENISDAKICVRLYQAIPNKYEKIEYILQKWTEVGVQEFVFFRSDRSQRLIINDRKIERFWEIVREAIEQCSGNQIPTITFLEDGLPTPENGSMYVFHTEENGTKHIRDIDPTVLPINIFVGPEGGWSSEEISFLENKGVQKIHLWKRILRTETTGVVAAFFLIQK